MTFAVIVIKFDAQEFIYPFELLQTEFAKCFPERKGFFLTTLKTPEPFPGIVFQPLLIFCFPVKLYIELISIINGILLQLRFFAPP